MPFDICRRSQLFDEQCMERCFLVAAVSTTMLALQAEIASGGEEAQVTEVDGRDSGENRAQM